MALFHNLPVPLCHSQLCFQLNEDSFCITRIKRMFDIIMKEFKINWTIGPAECPVLKDKQAFPIWRFSFFYRVNVFAKGLPYKNHNYLRKSIYQPRPPFRSLYFRMSWRMRSNKSDNRIRDDDIDDDDNEVMVTRC